MSNHNLRILGRNRGRIRSQAGLTLVELIIAIALIGIIVPTMYRFFGTTFSQYISLQKEGSSFSELSMQSQRVANVMRGTTGIISVTNDQIDCYAYFAPSDAYASRIRYYKTNSNTKLMADVTRLTSNPPIGTEIAGSTKTFTIIPNFYQAAGVKTFTYLDSGGNTLALPITDMRTIKGIQVTLASGGGNLSANSNQTISVQVSLRNRKVNL